MSEGVLIQPRQWRKLAKKETVWVQIAGPEGLHFTQDGQEYYVLPGDYILDFADERLLCRGRDMVQEIRSRGFAPEAKVSYDCPQPWYRIDDRTVVEVAHHITGDGVVHEDLWVERKNEQAFENDTEKLIVHRQQYVEELLADGYQWEDDAK